MTDRQHLPYRPCVGVMLANRHGKVWVGRRIEAAADAEGAGKWWQMPQGGIDENETAEIAAKRELREETGIVSASLITMSRGFFHYDLPSHLIGIAWKGRFRGQKQRWALFRFDGEDTEIDISGQGHKAEFDRWRWAAPDELPELIVPFKRQVYEKVIAEFRPFIAASHKDV